MQNGAEHWLKIFLGGPLNCIFIINVLFIHEKNVKWQLITAVKLSTHETNTYIEKTINHTVTISKLIRIRNKPSFTK